MKMFDVDHEHENKVHECYSRKDYQNENVAKNLLPVDLPLHDKFDLADLIQTGIKFECEWNFI